MNVTFADEPLYENCAVLANAERTYGSLTAIALVSFLEEARNVETAEELIGLLGPDIIIDDDSLSVAIGSDYRAAFVVVGTRHRRDAMGRIEWASVTRMKMLEMSRVP